CRGWKTGRLGPSVIAERAEASQCLFVLSQHIMPAAGQVALRIRAKVMGIPLDEATVAQGEQALQPIVGIVDRRLAANRWMLGADFSLVDCAYCPVLNVIEKAGFSLVGCPSATAYLNACRARPAWKNVPKLPALE